MNLLKNALSLPDSEFNFWLTIWDRDNGWKRKICWWVKRGIRSGKLDGY